jgi:acyl phosphate:glycerol-3-phosphate acyltransferase
MLHPISWQIAWPYYAAALAFGYLLGSIPFGIIFTRLAGTPDIRAIGSGSIGATNVLRTGRKELAAATVLADALKGTVAVLAMYWWWGRDHAMLAGIGAFVGHLFPIWLMFKGGKGVATFLGVLLAISWAAALVFGAIWLAVAAVTRYSSLASLLACAAVPIYFWFSGERQEAQVFLLLLLLTTFMHRGNIARLWQGTEGKIGQKAEASRGA